MTNTKFRKRALLSSVAMLLVALVALGSATFAWFSQNSKATANDIGAKTQQGSNIKVSESGNSDSWAESITFATKASGYYTPVTPGGAKVAEEPADVDMTNPVWVTTTSSSMNTGIKGSDKTYSAAEANTNYTSTNLWVKYDAATTTSKKVNIGFSSSGTGVDTFLRVALVPVNDAAKGLFGNTAVVWGAAADDFALDPAAFTALDASNTGKSVTTTTSKTLYTEKELVGGTEYRFALYVWFEGTDPQCIDSNANTDFDIDFTVEAA